MCGSASEEINSHLSYLPKLPPLHTTPLHMHKASGMSKEWFQEDLEAIRDCAFISGLLLRSSTNPNDFTVKNIAVNITPLPFPAKLYHLGVEIQPALNLLVDAVSRDHAFLEESLKRVIKLDHFTKKLFDIYSEVRLENKEVCVLGMHRSDYMLDYKQALETGQASLSLKQIELNTIASSTFGFMSRLKSFHEYMSSRYQCQRQTPMQIADNDCLTGMSTALVTAWKDYGNKSAYVLMVVNPREKVVFDQRFLEIYLLEKHSIWMLHKTLTQLSDEISLGPDKELIVAGVHCSVVYYRMGYSPDHYPSEKEWHARLLLEKSRAINCPTVAYQLVGTKKIQQKLAEPGVLERFVSDEETVRKIRSTFAGLYSLDMTPEGDRAMEMALKEPQKFVMKPQREGGGNNFYGDEISARLEEMKGTDKRGAYILMERVFPPFQTGVLMGPDTVKLERTPIINELGIYGTFFRKGDRVILNSSAGHSMRTKLSSENEGGVSLGVGAVDSPCLVPEDEFIKNLNQH